MDKQVWLLFDRIYGIALVLFLLPFILILFSLFWLYRKWQYYNAPAGCCHGDCPTCKWGNPWGRNKTINTRNGNMNLTKTYKFKIKYPDDGQWEEIND